MIFQNFGTKFLFRRGECKTRKNSNFRKKGKTVSAMCGHRFGGVPITPRGRDLFLLLVFFG